MATFLARLLLLTTILQPAFALEAPTGTVLVRVTGNISATNSGTVAEFDAAMLDRLPQHKIVSGTPWYSDVKTFQGPLLKDILALVGAKGTQLNVTALNDFTSRVPMQDVQNHNVILARWLDGKPLTVRTKGPTFIVYPFDENPEFRSDVYYNRCVWQVKTIVVE